MKYPLPPEDKIASLYSKFQNDKVTINKTEELIGIFGTLCDYMVDNGRCDVFCHMLKPKIRMANVKRGEQSKRLGRRSQNE